MSNPEFTIIIPVHNGANYIRAALESVLSQTYTHFQILILENASTDSTVDIIHEFADDRITIVPAASALNIEQNWGRIVEQPLTGYITFMGHDDVLYPDFLAEVVTLIAAEPDASLYQVQFEAIDLAGNPFRHPATIAYRESADQFLLAVMEDREEVCGTGYVVRVADYKQIGGIPAFPGLLYADVVLWYRLTALSYKICSPKTLAGYRVHSQSTHQHINLSRYYDALREYHQFLLVTESFKANSAAVDRYINRLLQRTYRTAAAQNAFLPDDERKAVLSRAKQQIAADGLFVLDDLPARIYEVVSGLPGFLRHAAVLPIVGWRWLRRLLNTTKC
jgi:glycosyltransferase involved in cell wall biosynthesis